VTSSRRGSSTRNATAGENESSRQLLVPSNAIRTSSASTPHRVPRAVDRQGTRGALLSRPATNRRRDRRPGDNYRNTVNRVLKRFRNCGLVGTDDGRYDFNGDFDRLHEFARELAHHLHRQRLESVAPKGTILWEDHDKFLAQTETEIDAEGFHETGLARFAAFDLQFLLTDHRYYLYSEHVEEISSAELCCHTLLIDDDSRYRSYCLLLLSHVDVDEDDLRERAAKYGLEDEIDALLQYLETHGGSGRPSPRVVEFQELAAEYEINR